MQFSRFYAEHLSMFVPVEGGVVTRDAAKLYEGDWAFSGFTGGECVGSAGIVTIWPGRALVWAFFSKQAAPHLLPIARFAGAMIEAHSAWRFEAAVRVGFVEGERLMRVLGFDCESPCMRKYDPQKNDYRLFARITG